MDLCCCCQRLVQHTLKLSPPCPGVHSAPGSPSSSISPAAKRGWEQARGRGGRVGSNGVGLNGNALGFWAPGDAWWQVRNIPLCCCTHLALLQQQLLESMPWSDPTCQTGQTDEEGRKRTPAPTPTAPSKPCQILSTKNHISSYLHSLNTNPVYFTPLCIFFSNYSLLLQRTSHVSLDLRRIFWIGRTYF